MDEEGSHSTSQESSNSREVVQRKTTIYSPGNEANRHLISICLDCEVQHESYNEETRQVNLEEFQQRVRAAGWDLEEVRRDLEEIRWDLEEIRQCVERPLEGLPRVIITEEYEALQDLDKTRQRVEQPLEGSPHVIITEEHETPRDLEETHQRVGLPLEGLPRVIIVEEDETLRDLEETRQVNLEEFQQHVRAARRDLEVVRRDLEETRQDLEETRQDLEEIRHRVERPLEGSPRIIITEEHETLRDLGETRQRVERPVEGSPCVIIAEEYETLWDLEETRQRVESSLDGPPRVIITEEHETLQDLEETRQRVERSLEDPPRVIITEEHETLSDLEETQQRVERPLEGSPSVIIIEEHETLRDLEETRQHVEWPLEGLPNVIITEEHETLQDLEETRQCVEHVCAICLDPFSVGSIVKQLPCLHFFHTPCILPWLEVNMSCPNCRYKFKLSRAFWNETRQNSIRRMGFQDIVYEGFIMNSYSTTSSINEPVVVSESHNGTTDSSVRHREGSRGGWFLYAAASIVGIALVECLQNFLGDGRGRGSTGHVEFPRRCRPQVRMFSSGSSSTWTSNSRENSRTLNR